MRAHIIAATAGLLLSAGAAQAQSFTFKTLDNPTDPTFNQLLGINDAGVIAGYYGSGLKGHPNKGYTIAKPYTHFVAANYPGSKQTQATGINAASTITGFYSNTNLGGGDANFGFIRQKNAGGGFTFTLVKDPNTGGAPQINQVLGINVHNTAAGFYLDAAGNSHGFAFQLGPNTFTEVKLNNASQIAATGINDNDEICGFFVNAKGTVTGGFVTPESGKGTTVELAVPHATVTQLLGINNMAQTVGFYMGNDNIPHGLYFNPVTKAYQTVDNPMGVNGNVINGINNMGQLVGFYTDADNNTHGEIVTVGP
jgi:hypothetical protein